MKIAVGNDHTACAYKTEIVAHLQGQGYYCVDFGAGEGEKVDYPVIGEKVGRAVASGECDLAVLICGTGIGISLAANKVRGVRAAVCSEEYSARLARRHNDANIICFGARVVGVEAAKAIVDAFLGAEFEGGRHADRVNMIARIENGEKL